MQVIFESRHPQGGALREEALRRVRFVLRRLGAVVPRAKVMFTDINGPRGGVDKHCLLEVKTEKSGVLVISSLASDWRTALDEGLDRLVRALTRTLHRQQKPVRGRLVKQDAETL
ncbi:HPF/RaiA family ribosome-associated protein [Rhodoferax mekongensis]|uniref:HPF/RaiA family ribosome-associated protein n=1 Tax=Rhodoferax mekongensis TaxID=3068341 RepID=A0ABZ0AZB5_9BURK|nr:HPF/RaiA family ribosome-associated protein [Rhodoferax sp. TBRC 17307]WNO04685.1 HPF/RaiA family ribosome-associated protein [Rhodoferax sp. TBRC 17307]